jgi:HPt (histidine-containing phosphotransfer) domain-containing protein
MKHFKPISWQPLGDSRYAQSQSELGNKLIYYFLKDSRERFSEITGALKAGDIKLAHRLAHTLKSNAGLLDKILLRNAAAEVEYRLKDGKNLVTNEQLKTLETELNTVLAEFSSKAETGFVRPDEKYPGSQEPLDTESAGQVIKKLEPMLEMGNTESLEFIGSLCVLPYTEELIQHIEDLNFGQALVALAELKRKIGLTENDSSK